MYMDKYLADTKQIPQSIRVRLHEWNEKRLILNILMSSPYCTQFTMKYTLFGGNKRIKIQSTQIQSAAIHFQT